MAPLVSVVMPCFNVAPWLSTALDSLWSQQLADLEVIAVDDGSADSTGSLLEAHARREPRLRVVRLESNVGLAKALNRGLAEARGAFIARMDADDVALPHRLRSQLQFLEASGVDLCGSWFIEFGQGVPRAVRWPHAETAVRAHLLFQNPICHPTVLARRHVFDQFRYREDYRFGEDYDLFSRAAEKFRLANVPQPLLRYRRHPGQATQARRDVMESFTRQIRLASLARQGFAPDAGEQRLHNLIRGPHSIASQDDLRGIEAWLGKLLAAHADAQARAVIAGQWIRACIRAAPLGRAMWRAYRGSRLRAAAGAGVRADFDLAVLAALRLDYEGAAFFHLRRLGLSA